MPAEKPIDPQKVIKNPDLHLVDDDDLIEELASRNKRCFIIWCEKDTSGGVLERRRFAGDMSNLLGSAERIYRIMLSRTDKTDRDCK